VKTPNKVYMTIYFSEEKNSQITILGCYAYI